MKEQLRDYILKLGADVCGFASIDRFDGAPRGFHPKDLFENCKTVIVFGSTLPKGLLYVDSRLIYGHYNEKNCQKVDEITFEAAKFIEKTYNQLAVPLPCDSPYEYWDKNKMEGRGLISMKHAAVQAGIGRLGKNSLLMNKDYGNLLTVGAILVDMEIESDQLSNNICIDSCDLCLKTCPAHALDGIGANQKACRENTYGSNERGFGTVDCNKCRTICPRRFGMV